MRYLVAILLFCMSGLLSAQQKTVTIVIDPGHGGTDPGHLSANKEHLAEKDINLLIAKKVGNYIERYLQNIQIVYTRTDDSYPSLDDRVAKANSIQADYFISIHCNADSKKNVHGTETHVHDKRGSAAVNLAKIMEKEFANKAGRHSRGVKDSDDREHTLQVLKYTNMTSILIECGFLTNEKEANFLNTANGQDLIASAIFRGIRTQVTESYPSISFIRSTPKGSEGATGGNTSGKFSIQIMSSKEPIETNDASFKKVGYTVKREKLSTTSAFKYRYLVGTYRSKEEAKTDLEKVQKNGFKDAYIIALE